MAKQGLLVRRLDALEALAHVDRVYFDKTGTLTEGALRVVGLVTEQASHTMFAGLALQWAERWHMAAALASHSQHPLSTSLVKAAQDAGGWAGQSWLDVREHAGKGVEARDQHGLTWRLGARHWVLEGADASIDLWAAKADEARVWLAARTAQGVFDARSVSGFVFDETFRPEAGPAIKRLVDLGCQSALLSGDQESRVVAAVQHLGAHGEIVMAKAHATPEDKLQVIAAIQALGHRVAVVGDGINDAPVLAKADVSIALDQGAALAQSQADLIVLGGRLLGVPLAVETARRAMRIVKQNLAWAAIYNLSCIPLALMGLLPPWLAGLGMALSSLGVVLNALRLGASRS
jgi:Cu2+-exporting ATPase